MITIAEALLYRASSGMVEEVRMNPEDRRDIEKEEKLVEDSLRVGRKPDHERRA